MEIRRQRQVRDSGPPTPRWRWRRHGDQRAPLDLIGIRSCAIGASRGHDCDSRYPAKNTRSAAHREGGGCDNCAAGVRCAIRAMHHVLGSMPQPRPHSLSRRRSGPRQCGGLIADRYPRSARCEDEDLAVTRFTANSNPVHVETQPCAGTGRLCAAPRSWMRSGLTAHRDRERMFARRRSLRRQRDAILLVMRPWRTETPGCCRATPAAVSATA